MRKLLINLTLFAVVLGSCVVAAEFTVRYIYRDIRDTAVPSFFKFQARRENPDRVNMWGFRDRDYDAVAPEGVYRIAVIGDSLTYGQGIAEEDRLTNILGARLSTQGLRYEVMNFGRSGTDTVHHIGFLEEFVLPLQPDLVILQWFVNDYEGDDRAGRPPAALKGWSHGVLLRRSALYFLVSQQLQKLILWYRGGETYFDYLEKRYGDFDDAEWQAYQKLLGSFVARTRQAGAEVAFLIYPLSRNSAEAETRLASANAAMMRECEAMMVPCIDFLPHLEAVGNPKSLLGQPFGFPPQPQGQ